MGPVRCHIDVYGGHGWLYVRGGQWVIEHTSGNGHWGGCFVGMPYGVPDRALEQATMRHLQRRPHLGPLPQCLAGPDRCHGGGGAQINGQWARGPNLEEELS